MEFDQNDRPLVSIIVPVYNVEKYLGACVDSIVRQSYKNIEIILIDDGSTDSSGDLCDQWAKEDPRIRVIHQNNRGLSSARNTGLDNCSGECITFIDSDDYVAEDYLETLWRLINLEGVTISQVGANTAGKPIKNDNSYSVMNTREYLKSSMFMTAAWGKLYLRKAFDGVRFPDGKVYEDNAVVYKVVYFEEKLALTEDVLYFCNIRDDSINTRSRYSLKRLDRLIFDKEAIQFYSQNNENELEKNALRFYAYDLLENYVEVRKHYPEKTDTLKEIKREFQLISSSVVKDPAISCKTKMLLKIANCFPGIWSIVIKDRER